MGRRPSLACRSRKSRSRDGLPSSAHRPRDAPDPPPVAVGGMRSAGGQPSRTRNQLLLARGDGIQSEFIRHPGIGKMIHLVALGWVRGIEVSPVSLWPIPIPLADIHFVSAPVDRNAGVAILCIGHGRAHVGGLAPSVHAEQPGSLRHLGDTSRMPPSSPDALERANLVADESGDNSIFLPLPENLDFQKFFVGIISSPQFCNVLRGLAVLQWGQRVLPRRTVSLQQQLRQESGESVFVCTCRCVRGRSSVGIF